MAHVKIHENKKSRADGPMPPSEKTFTVRTTFLVILRCGGVQNMPRNRKRKVPTKVVLKGKGDYSQAITSMPAGMNRLESKIDHLEKSLVKTTPTVKSAAATIGRTLGNFVNQGDLGALAGSSLARYFGHGDYELKSNSLVKAVTTGAKFASVGRGTRIAEREFIGNVVSGTLSSGSSIFTNKTYVINPSNENTFPWLSRLAPLYDQWEPHGIVFEYISTSSDFNGASQALGAVIMATDYDPYDLPYTTKQQMENSDYACSSKPSLALIHGVECAPSERPTKLLYTAVGNGAPLTSTLLGNFQVATQGCAAAGVTLGELWVSYDITFYKKQLDVPLSPVYCAFGTTTGGAGYITNPTVTSSYQITIGQTSGSSTVYFNNPSATKFVVEYYNLVSQAADSTAVGSVNCTVTSKIVKPATGAYLLTFVVTCTAPSAYFAFGTQGAIATAYSVGVTEVPMDYVF